MYHVLSRKHGRKLGGSEVAYAFGDPIKSAPGRRLIPGMCTPPAQPDPNVGYPCPRAFEDMKWLVNWSSDPGGTILDPFTGTGSIPLAAKLLGRNATGIDIEPAYLSMARRHIAGGRLAAPTRAAEFPLLISAR